MLNTGGAVQKVALRNAAGANSSRLVMDIQVRGAGRLAVYLSCTPHAVQLQGQAASFEYWEAEELLLVTVPDSGVEGLIGNVRVHV